MPPKDSGHDLLEEASRALDEISWIIIKLEEEV